MPPALPALSLPSGGVPVTGSRVAALPPEAAHPAEIALPAVAKVAPPAAPRQPAPAPLAAVTLPVGPDERGSAAPAAATTIPSSPPKEAAKPAAIAGPALAAMRGPWRPLPAKPPVAAIAEARHGTDFRKSFDLNSAKVIPQFE